MQKTSAFSCTVTLNLAFRVLTSKNSIIGATASKFLTFLVSRSAL